MRRYQIQIHLVVLNSFIERLHRVTLSHVKATWNCWCQCPEVFKLRRLLSEPLKYRTVNFWNRDSGLEKSCCIDIYPNQVQSPDADFLYEQATLSRMTDAYIYSLKQVLEHGPTDQQSHTLTYVRLIFGYLFVWLTTYEHTELSEWPVRKGLCLNSFRLQSLSETYLSSNLVNLNSIWIAFAIFRFILYQTR